MPPFAGMDQDRVRGSHPLCEHHSSAGQRMRKSPLNFPPVVPLHDACNHGGRDRKATQRVVAAPFLEGPEPVLAGAKSARRPTQIEETVGASSKELPPNVLRESSVCWTSGAEHSRGALTRARRRP
jgi:hypothetical protein